MKNFVSLLIFLFLFAPKQGGAQPNQEQIGAWYMYFVNHDFKNSQWGFQGDVQFRNWDYGSDLEQLLIRAGVTFRPKNANIKFTVGYGSITTGVFGDSDGTSYESRIYQEALYPVKFGNRFYTSHRFRYEQRFVENQDFRTRYRYNFFINVPINRSEMTARTFYLALYNELFINGERGIGNGNSVELFDRNRFYSALGFIIKKGMKVQIGIMNQATDGWKKNQFQLSFHHSF